MAFIASAKKVAEAQAQEQAKLAAVQQSGLTARLGKLKWFSKGFAEGASREEVSSMKVALVQNAAKSGHFAPVAAKADVQRDVQTALHDIKQKVLELPIDLDFIVTPDSLLAEPSGGKAIVCTFANNRLRTSHVAGLDPEIRAGLLNGTLKGLLVGASAHLSAGLVTNYLVSLNVKAQGNECVDANNNVAARLLTGQLRDAKVTEITFLSREIKESQLLLLYCFGQYMGAGLAKTVAKLEQKGLAYMAESHPAVHYRNSECDADGTTRLNAPLKADEAGNVSMTIAEADHYSAIAKERLESEVSLLDLNSLELTLTPMSRTNAKREVVEADFSKPESILGRPVAEATWKHTPFEFAGTLMLRFIPVGLLISKAE